MAVEPEEIQGRWVLSAVAGASVDQPEPPHFTIDGRMISGYDGCNNFSGALDDPAMMIVGQRACAGEYLKLPLDLADPLADLARAELRDGALHLAARGDLPEAEFTAGSR